MLSNQNHAIPQITQPPGIGPAINGSEINIALNRVRTAIGRSSDLSGHILDRLNDVLGPSGPTGEKIDKIVSNSPMADVLNGLAEKLEDANYSFSMTLTRIQL